MPIEIKMPQLSDTMSSGKILVWKKKEGELIERGEILAEVETDKANLEIEAFHKGKLLKIAVPVGAVAKVGEVIALIGDAVEVSTNAPLATPAMAVIPEFKIPAAAITPQPAPVHTVAPVQSFSTPPNLQVVGTIAESGRIKASPLARKIAEERHIDLSVLKGSGPDGRIVKKDIDEARPGAAPTPSIPLSTAASTPAKPTMAAPAPAAATRPSTTSSIPTGGSVTPFSRMRETIARRMQESVREAPHFYTSVSINMGQAMELRKVLKAKPEFKDLSLNHFVIKACAYALQNEPRVNRAVKDGQVYQPAGINIGIITAIEDGLLIPVIKDADKLPLKDLVFEAKAAVDRARAGRPNATDLSGGTFSISNMGMLDVENFTAIINPGQGAVLAVSSIKEQPIVIDKQIVIGSIMNVTLSVDHRVIDGLMSGSFLKFFKQALEVPALLVM